MIQLAALLVAMHQPDTLPPLPPLPAPRQIAWQDMETNAFVHFGPNTFTDKEWGGGNEDPNLFDPTDLDCDQWVKTLKSAGFKGVIITAKHHDGFCLWPSKQSTHTVAQSKWRGGKGDVLKELSDACHRNGLKFGVYLSPWDRNHPSYGTPEYNKVFVAMLTEVLTHYGPVFEVWFDGANGEGPNGKKQVYDWPLFFSTVRKLQPKAVIFGDGGPDVRWVGNEGGEASLTSWSTIPSNRYINGTPLSNELGEGREDGDQWTPPECDVSIRPGWFYHPEQGTKVKLPEHLLELYEKSVGRNGLLLLNVPPDRRGHFTDEDVASLKGFKRLLDSAYRKNLARGAKIEASSSLGAFDLSKGSYWAAKDGDAMPSLTVTLSKPTLFNRVVLGEPISLGQRVKSFRVEFQGADGRWRSLAEGTTIGRKRILPVDKLEVSRLRITITASRATPALDRFGLYLAG